jgi:hypothetical protein
MQSTFASLMVVLAVCGGESHRTVLRNATLVMLSSEGEARLLPHHSIIIEEGLIAGLKVSEQGDLRDGDVLVDAEGLWVVPGLIEISPVPASRYAELAERPLRGVLSIASSYHASEKAWLERAAKTAALPCPSVLSIDEKTLQASLAAATRATAAPSSREEAIRWLFTRTQGEASRLLLADRGSLAVGMRGDLLILERDPLSDPSCVERPKEIILGGKPHRNAALETHRKMIATANQALAARPSDPLPDAVLAEQPWIFEIESSGLRVGRFTMARDATAATEWWGPPIELSNSWRYRPAPPATKGWTLRLVEDVTHGMRTAIDLEQRATDLWVKAQVTRPEELPASEATIPAVADAPFVDPLSLVQLEWHRLGRLEIGESIRIEVAEPMPMLAKVKVGVRTLSIVRLAERDAPLPLRAGRWAFRIDALPGQEAVSKSESKQASPEPIGWVITDSSGIPQWAGLDAPEGVTEYFLSLPQPAHSSEPQSH